MAVTIHGLNDNQAVWQPDFRATRDKKGEWTATQSYKCKASAFLNTLPKLGDPAKMEGFNFIGLTTIDVSALEGDIVQVFCKYGAGNDVGGNSGGSGEMTEWMTSLEYGTSEEPIQYCKRYYDKVGIEMIDKVTAGLLKLNTDKDGNEKWVDDEGNEYKDDIIGKLKTFSGKTADLALTKECARKILFGQTHYLSPALTWSWRGRRKNKLDDSELSKLGYIDNAPLGNPPIPSGNFNWLLLSVNQDKEGDYWNITKTWQMSSARGWDEEIYKK